ncbi:hypothetical protein [Pyruvatibacter sp.]
MTYHAQTRPAGLIARCLTAIVCRRAPDQVIADAACPSGVYVNRWVLWSSGFNWRFWRKQDRMGAASRHGARLLLHEVLRADADMRPHNHPWDWAFALVISGGYAEVRLTDFCGVRLATTWRWPWRLYRLSGTDFHRISGLRERASWSLFLHGPRRHGWGFIEALPPEDGSDCWGARFDPFEPDSHPPTP